MPSIPRLYCATSAYLLFFSNNNNVAAQACISCLSLGRRLRHTIPSCWGRPLRRSHAGHRFLRSCENDIHHIPSGYRSPQHRLDAGHHAVPRERHHLRFILFDSRRGLFESLDPSNGDLTRDHPIGNRWTILDSILIRSPRVNVLYASTHL